MDHYDGVQPYTSSQGGVIELRSPTFSGPEGLLNIQKVKSAVLCELSLLLDAPIKAEKMNPVIIANHIRSQTSGCFCRIKKLNIIRKNYANKKSIFHHC